MADHPIRGSARRFALSTIVDGVTEVRVDGAVVGTVKHTNHGRSGYIACVPGHLPIGCLSRKAAGERVARIAVGVG